MTYVIDDDRLDAMHPRQQAVLRPFTPEVRGALSSRASLIQNTRPGYIFSQALQCAADDLARVGGDLDALEHMNRVDNRAALASCPCATCQRDFANSKGV